MTRKCFSHSILFTGAFLLLAGCANAEIVTVDSDPTGACSSYSNLYLNLHTGVETACVNGQYQSAPLGGGGTPGPQGPAGTAATVTVGGTTTGAPGTNASVTNSGTANAAVLNFVIPQGATGSAGSGGSGGSAKPFNMNATATSLDIGTDCASSPCVERVGSLAKSFSTDFIANMPSGSNATEMAYVYFDPNNQTAVTVGTNTVVLTAPYSGAGAGTAFATGITQFPAGSLPLYTVQIANGAFSTVTDLRSILSAGNVISAGNCITTTGTTTGYSIALQAGCGGSGGTSSTFNGGTITAPLIVNTNGTGGNTPLLKLALSSSTGYNVFAMDDDLGEEWQLGVAGSAATNGLAKYFYLRDGNANNFLTVNPSTDDVIITSGATGQNPLTLTSGTTNATAFNIWNTSTGGHAWSITSGGANNGPGRMTFYDATANSVELAVNAANHLTTVNLLQLQKAAPTAVTAPTCSASFASTLSVDGSGHLQFCDGTAWHSITYLN